MNEQRAESRAWLVLKMTFLLYVVGHALILLHELGHGIAALLLGGYFPFVQIDAEGGRSIYMFAFGEPLWKQGVVMVAGPLVNLLIPLGLLLYVRLAAPQGETRLVATLSGAISSLMFLTASGLIPFWVYGYKEIGQGFIFLGIPSNFHQWVKIAFVIIGVILGAAFFRMYFAQMRQRFPSRGYWGALKMVTFSTALPVVIVMAFLSIIMLMAGHSEGVITLTRHSPHAAFLVLSYLLLPLIVPSADPDRFGEARVSGFQLKTYGTLALVFLVAQAFVFGHDRRDPNGIFLSSQPPEVDVAACNVYLEVDQDLTAQVAFYMRPYVDQHDFLWERVKNGEPPDWEHYDRFLAAYLPTMVGTQDFEIVDRRSDPRARFFNQEWKTGARIVVAQVDLKSSQRLERRGKGYRWRFVDSWKARFLGYVDFAEITFDPAFRIDDVSFQPGYADAPSRRGQQLTWTNTDFGRSPEYVEISFR